MTLFSRVSVGLLLAGVLTAFAQSKSEVEARQRAEQQRQERQAREDATSSVADREHWPMKVFDIKNAEPAELQALLSVFRAQVSAPKTGSGKGFLAVRAPKEIMPAIEDTIRRFDVPPPVIKNVEVTAYLVAASEQGDSTGNVPTEMQGVVKQLKSVFPYQGFRLLETLVLRSRERGIAELSGVMAASGANLPAGTYQFTFLPRISSDEKGNVVSLQQLRLFVSIPVPAEPGGKTTYQGAAISAGVEVREGQKVVVGKSNVGGADKALFLVVTAKVMD